MSDGRDFSVLPPDIVQSILLSIPKMQDLMSCAAVNRRLHSIFLQRNIVGWWFHSVLPKTMMGCGLFMPLIDADDMTLDPVLDTPPSSVETYVPYLRLFSEMACCPMNGAVCRALPVKCLLLRDSLVSRFSFAMQSSQSRAVYSCGRHFRKDHSLVFGVIWDQVFGQACQSMQSCIKSCSVLRLWVSTGNMFIFTIRMMTLNAPFLAGDMRSHGKLGTLSSGIECDHVDLWNDYMYICAT
jgi:hypothetical protein